MKKEITTGHKCQLDRARNKNRNDLLQQPLPTKRNINKIQLITTYNRTLPNLHKAIEKYWHLLKIYNEISKVFTENLLSHITITNTSET